MLDFDPRTADDKQTRTTQVRHGERLALLIEQAATLLGVEKSVFLRSAIAKEAERIVEANARHVLTPEDAKAFSAAMDKPPAPTARAKKAAKDYRQRVRNAD